MCAFHYETTEEKLEKILNELLELNRPRLFFSIEPSNSKYYILDMVLKNFGRGSAYDISCSFEPDVPYGKETTLGKLALFKQIPFLGPGQEIRAFFDTSISYYGDGDNPKKTIVKISYSNSKKESSEEKYVLDIERYKGILFTDDDTPEKVITRELSYLRRVIEEIARKGIVTKTLAEAEKERQMMEERWKKIQEERARKAAEQKEKTEKG